MQIFILFLALFMTGLMAVPISIHGIGSLSHRNIGDVNPNIIENPNSVNNVKIFGNGVDRTDLMQQIASTKESNRFLGENNADVGTSLSLTNDNFPVTRSGGYLSALTYNPTRVMGGVAPPRKHAKRALYQSPSGFQLDGKHRFPYYNQRSIRRVNGLVNDHKILSTNRRLRRPSVQRKPLLLNKEKSSSP
ncbi:CSEP0290 putative effector protein [Blumeria hordei DH14]|uniref:CSEP0290 putative effector protein n=1 Tax=Blumeria graminis f. sp. hordei (strain DH14) TaxID=546991 RepID=N1J9Z5_BLUG1|nr:CSEP0290 putative effector protein [Blumeria hordei DH14]